MQLWQASPISTRWCWGDAQQKVEKRGYSRISCYSWSTIKSKLFVYLKIQIRRSLIHGKLENWDWTLRRTHSYEDQKHIEPRVQLHVPKKTLLIPQKCIDVTRSTRTDLNVAQEKRIDDYWNIDENRSLSDSWTDFTKFTLIERDTSKRIFVVRCETDKNSNDCTSRSFLAWSMDKNWKTRWKKRKTRMGTRKNKTRECKKFERNLSCWSKWWSILWHPQECKKLQWHLQCHVKGRSPKPAIG